MAPKGKELSKDLKKIIFNLHKNYLGYKLINNRIHISVNTIAKVIQKYKATGWLSNKHHPGRPSILTAHDIRHIQRCVMDDRRHTASSLAQEVSSDSGNGVSTQTVRRCLNRCGFHGCISHRKPLLTARHKSCCISFAEAYEKTQF
ncbi:TCB1 transposase [Octopus vulgaris]|uniref:TCB1 transposase n=1 Tax=Octopus vulgaris TaxID=6645 RepID=A0AA36BIA3_OCTVU|nr:TCB1 transposase [Octopus vulgaris]